MRAPSFYMFYKTLACLCMILFPQIRPKHLLDMASLSAVNMQPTQGNCIGCERGGRLPGLPCVLLDSGRDFAEEVINSHLKYRFMAVMPSGISILPMLPFLH